MKTIIQSEKQLNEGRGGVWLRAVTNLNNKYDYGTINWLELNGVSTKPLIGKWYMTDEDIEMR